jgi:hypothetical protein
VRVDDDAEVRCFLRVTVGLHRQAAQRRPRAHHSGVHLVPARDLRAPARRGGPPADRRKGAAPTGEVPKVRERE